MGKLRFEDNYKNASSKIEAVLSLLQFKEKEVTIIYSPALDLSGYGNNEKEAQKSFEITIEEFFRYTINKRTFETELKNLGWKLSGKNKI